VPTHWTRCEPGQRAWTTWPPRPGHQGSCCRAASGAWGRRWGHGRRAHAWRHGRHATGHQRQFGRLPRNSSGVRSPNDPGGSWTREIVLQVNRPRPRFRGGGGVGKGRTAVQACLDACFTPRRAKLPPQRAGTSSSMRGPLRGKHVGVAGQRRRIGRHAPRVVEAARAERTNERGAESVTRMSAAQSVAGNVRERDKSPRYSAGPAMAGPQVSSHSQSYDDRPSG